MTFDDMKEHITPRNPSRDKSPNRGGSIAQEEAISPIRKPLRQWQKEQNIDVSAQIKLTRIAHMRYQHTDLDEITTFLRDFGMTVAAETDTQRWFKGYGSDQYVYYAQVGSEKKFLGGTFEVSSFAELEKAARIPGASKIIDLSDAPGGGHLVTLHDPEGFPVNVMYGQEPLPAGPYAEPLITNYENHKPRIARFQRFKPGPAAVHKLGHFGLCVKDFPAMIDWYTRTFNLAPTDFLYVTPDAQDASGKQDSTRKDVASFMHIDTGAKYTDHHTFFMSTNTTSHVHHCSFEVHDFDTQKLGHAWLQSKKYTPVWGVGRHILGSQIFDYWWDTSGFMIEHYADGDLVNEDTPIGWGEAGDESLAVWGPEVPKWFLE